MKPQLDAVIIGAGHNGLVCACYLARAGLKVRVLERRAVIGGAAVTQEFAPGFRNSVAAYTVSLLQPKIIADLRLHHHGLRIVERPFANFLPLANGDSFQVGPDIATTQAALARFSKRDAARLPDYYAMVERVAAVLRGLVLKTPPNIGGGLRGVGGGLWGAGRGLRDAGRALSLGLQLRELDTPGRRDLLAFFTRSAGEILDDWFDSDAVKGAFGFDSVVGNFASPYAAGSGYVLLHHAFGEVNGRRGAWGHAIGGMGAISDALAAEARAHGVEIITDCGVTKVLSRDGRANGVVLADGGEIHARAVIGNLNPKLLYLDLVEAGDLEPDFVARMQGWRCASGSFRMNVALSELPDFSCRPGSDMQPHHSSGIIIGPSLDYLDRAWSDARAEGMSREPVIEILIPSTVDDSLVDSTRVPPGHHVASLFCQQFNPVLPEGRSWDERRDEAAALIIDTVTRHAPNFRNSIVATQILSPLDLERDFGLVGGDIFHGRLSLDQLFSARPVLGYADYRSPLEGLYLCGAGAHPGGGVTGAPGHNAAREVLRDFRLRMR